MILAIILLVLIAAVLVIGLGMWAEFSEYRRRELER